MVHPSIELLSGLLQEDDLYCLAIIKHYRSLPRRLPSKLIISSTSRGALVSGRVQSMTHGERSPAEQRVITASVQSTHADTGSI